MTEDNSGESDAKPVDARVARRRQDALGRRLRQMYDEVVEEPIPDDFLSFLEQADQRPQNKHGGEKSAAQAQSNPDRKDGGA